MPTRKLILLVTFMVWCFSAHPQTFSKVKVLSAANGLGNQNITCLKEDLQGFVWVGTEHGLFRFDGNEFRVLKNIGPDSTNLNSQHILSLANGTGGRLVVGTTAGLSILSADRCELSSPRYPGLSPEQQYAEKVLQINENTSLWTNRLGIYKVENGRVTTLPFSVEDHLPHRSRVQIFKKGKESFLFTATGQEVRLMNLEGKTLKKYNPIRPYQITNYDSNTGLLHVAGIAMELGQSYIFIDSYNDQGERVGDYLLREFPTEVEWLLDLMADENGNFWVVGQLSSSFFYNTKLRKTFDIKNFKRPVPEPKLIGLRHVLKDRNNNLWFTSNTRVYCINQGERDFKTLHPENLEKGELFSTRLIYQLSKNDLLVSSYAGNFILNQKTREFTKMPWSFSPYLRQHSIFMRDILKSEDGYMLIATEGEGILRLDLETGFIKPGLKDSLARNYIIALEKTPEHGIWATAYEGLYKFEDGELKRPAGIPDSVIQKLKPISELRFDPVLQVLWVATGKGLLEYDLVKDTYILHDIRIKDNPLATPLVHAMHFAESTLWLGTRESGLVKFNALTKKAQHFTVSNGLSNNTIYSIQALGEDQLWLGTAYGLSLFSIKEGRFRNYFEEDGIANNEFNSGSSLLTKNGLIYMGGIYGLTAFEPANILDRGEKAPLRLTRISKHNGKLNKLEDFIFDLERIRVLEVQPNDRYFVVNFAQENPFAKNNRFEYRLEGRDMDWQFLDNRNFIRFAGLDAGEYTLRIRRVGHLAETEADISLPIVVYAPWYNTLWGYSLFVLLIVGLVILFVRFRLKQLRMASDLRLEQLQAEKLEELDRMKSGFFANISHEFRTPLTLILGPLQKKKVSESDKGLIKRNASRLLSLINQLLDLSKLEHGKMKMAVAEYDLNAHLRLIVANFNSSCSQNEISLNIEIPDTPITLYYDYEKLEAIMYNLLSNAIKFCNIGGEVKVVCNMDGNDENVSISVSNTGAGIPKEKLDKVFEQYYQLDTNIGRGTGLGLALVKEMVKLHCGSIAVTSQENQETVFTVNLPLGKHHFNNEDLVEADSVLPAANGKEGVEAVVPKSSNERLEVGLQDETRPLVLIVDDNEDLREFIGSILSVDYRTIEAPDGAEGVERALQHIPDLVISDLMMPIMDGNALCEKLKTNEITSHIPVILLTAKATRQSKLLGLETGADDYILKPFDREELLLRAKNLIHTRQHLREKYQVSTALDDGHKPPKDLNESFLQKAIGTVEIHLENEHFTAEMLCEQLNLSARQVQRKLKAVAGLTPTLFIRQVRLQHARQLLVKGKHTVSEVSYAVGFSSASYFSKAFKQEFGQLPSAFLPLSE